MTICNVKKQKEQLCAESKYLSPNAEVLENEMRGITIKEDCTKEFRDKVAKAIEANNLCYNNKTGFHYMK